MSIAEDLRQMADLLDANPDLKFAPAGGVELTLYLDIQPTFADAVRALKRFGVVAKDRNPDTGMFRGEVKLNKTIRLKALDHGNDVVCERVQVGTETIEQPIMEQVGVETIERPVFEWRCPESILAGAPS